MLFSWKLCVRIFDEIISFRWGFQKLTQAKFYTIKTPYDATKDWTWKNTNQDEHTKKQHSNQQTQRTLKRVIYFTGNIHLFFFAIFFVALFLKKIEFPLFHRHEFVLVFPRLQRTNFGPASKMLQQINICASMKVADSLHKIFTTANLCIWDSEKKNSKIQTESTLCCVSFWWRSRFYFVSPTCRINFWIDTNCVAWFQHSCCAFNTDT